MSRDKTVSKKHINKIYDFLKETDNIFQKNIDLVLTDPQVDEHTTKNKKCEIKIENINLFAVCQDDSNMNTLKCFKTDVSHKTLKEIPMTKLINLALASIKFAMSRIVRSINPTTHKKSKDILKECEKLDAKMLDVEFWMSIMFIDYNMKTEKLFQMAYCSGRIMIPEYDITQLMCISNVPQNDDKSNENSSVTTSRLVTISTDSQ